MAHTVNDILLAVYGELGAITSGIATGGSATTLVDSGRKSDKAQDATWNNATLFITRDAGGENAAPEGEFAEIASYANSTGTFTVASGALTTAPATGDYYSVAVSEWKLDDVRQSLIRALQRLGRIPVNDKTSLDTAAGTTRYTLPAAAKGGLRRVYQETLSSTDDERPTEIFDWRVELSATGSGEELVLRSQPTSGRNLHLVYMGYHDKLWDYDDQLSEYVELERIVAEVVYLLLKQKKRREKGTNKALLLDLNDAARELEIARKRFPILDPGTPFKPLLKSRSARQNKYGPWLP